MPSIPINNLTNKTDINGQELLPFVRDGKTYRCSISSVFFNNAVSQSVISNGAVTPSKLSTGGPSWTAALTGGTFSVPQNGLEFGTGYAQDFECFVDLHTAAIPTDFQTRLSRTGGANGNFRILNNGTGNILLSSGTGNISLSANGNVGIGTTAPGAKLDIVGGNVDDSLPELRISGSGGSISTYVSLCAGFYNPIVRDDDKGIIFTGGTVNTGNLVIAPHATSTSGIRMLSSGNVGIGKHTPTTTLDVDGTVTATYVTLCSTPTNPSHATTKEYVDSKLQLGTAQISTASTFFIFGGIPSTTKRITFILSGVSTSSSADMIVQIGTSGGLLSSDYISYASDSGGTQAFTTGFGLTRTYTSTNFNSGTLVLTKLTGNTWVASGNIGNSSGVSSCVGTKTLPDDITYIAILTDGGLANFDAGQVNIMYE